VALAGIMRRPVSPHKSGSRGWRCDVSGRCAPGRRPRAGTLVWLAVG
jgi:hypothetical protein